MRSTTCVGVAEEQNRGLLWGPLLEGGPGCEEVYLEDSENNIWRVPAPCHLSEKILRDVGEKSSDPAWEHRREIK